MEIRRARLEDAAAIAEVHVRTWQAAYEHVFGAERLAGTLAAGRAVAARFKDLARLRLDVPVGTVDDWVWKGPRPELGDWCARFGSPRLAERAAKLAARRESGNS